MATDLATHTLHFNYDPSEIDISVLRMAHLLDGRDDTQDTRDLYQTHHEKNTTGMDWTPMEHDGQLFPRWLILEYFALKVQLPQVAQSILDSGADEESFPAITALCLQ